MIRASQNTLTPQRRFQFSLRRLLIFTAVAAVLVAISLSYYRQQTANRRKMLFFQAIRNGNLAEVDQLLNIDPRLAHGQDHGIGFYSHTALQSALGHLFTYNPKVVTASCKKIRM